MRFDAEAVAERMIAGLEPARDQFPRNLAFAALASLPISIIQEEGLTTAAIEQRLGRVLPQLRQSMASRRLRGCLVAMSGQGYIFLDEDDPAAVAFALGHELAHFVGHYLHRRELAVARLGRQILEVLDGKRAPTPDERLGGALSHCPLGVFSDIMEREGGQPVSALAERMEAEADEAAFLALAPPRQVLARARNLGGGENAVEQVLQQVFGLTLADARRHSPRVLATGVRAHGDLLSGLRGAAWREEARTRGMEADHGF